MRCRVTHWIKQLCLVSGLLLFTSLHASELPRPSHPELENVYVISRFTDLEAAQKLQYSLTRSGQEVTLIPLREKINLKALSLGLYPDAAEAGTVVRHLKKNNINAYPYKLKNGEYRVHAGAMQNEEYYWERFEKLLSLGYKRIHTVLQPIEIDVYYLVRDKAEEDRFAESEINKRQQTPRPSRFPTEFLEGRFKGEFSAWGPDDNVSSSNYFKAALSAKTRYQAQWELIYGIRFDASEQSSDENLQKFEFQMEPTYLNYRLPNHLWSIGAIDARWDERNTESLSDLISSKNLSRYRLDEDLKDRRRPVYGIRWQYTQTEFNLDVIWNPLFQGAKLPDFGNIWHPVSRSRKAIMGRKSDDNLEYLISRGSFADEEFLSGSIGVRMSQTIGSRTRATTLQYVRQSEPYYRLNPDISRLIKQGVAVDVALAQTSNAAFTPEHPYSGVFTWEEFGKVSRIEIAIKTDTPYTTTDYKMKTAMSFDWILGFQYPKTHRNVVLSAYFAGRHINTTDSTLERKTKLDVLGELSAVTESQKWKYGLLYELNLDDVALFLHPQVAYTQSKYVKISLGYQLFTGSGATEFGYHTRHSILSLSWQAIF